MLVMALIGERDEGPEQAVILTIGTGGEEERVGIPSRAAGVSKSERPKAVNDNRSTDMRFEQSLEFAFGIECHNRAAAEIADEQIAAMFTEGIRRKSQTPW